MTWKQKLAEIFVEITAKLEPFKKSMDQAKVVLQKTMASIRRFVFRIGRYITTAFIAMGAAAIKWAADVEEAEALFKVAMGESADETRAWSEELAKTLKRNQYEIRKTVGVFTILLKTMGIATKEAANLSRGLIEISYNLAAMHNLKPEEIFDKMQSGIVGMPRPLRSIGILINDLTVKQYALAKGLGGANGELSEQEKVLARISLIMDQAQIATGYAVREIDNATSVYRSLRDRIKVTAIEIGKSFLPALTKVGIRTREWIIANEGLIKTRVVGWLTRFIERLKELGPLIAGIAKHWKLIGGLAIATALAPAIVAMGKLILGLKAAGKWVRALGVKFDLLVEAYNRIIAAKSAFIAWALTATEGITGLTIKTTLYTKATALATAATKAFTAAIIALATSAYTLAAALGVLIWGIGKALTSKINETIKAYKIQLDIQNNIIPSMEELIKKEEEYLNMLRERTRLLKGSPRYIALSASIAEKELEIEKDKLEVFKNLQRSYEKRLKIAEKPKTKTVQHAFGAPREILVKKTPEEERRIQWLKNKINLQKEDIKTQEEIVKKLQEAADIELKRTERESISGTPKEQLEKELELLEKVGGSARKIDSLKRQLLWIEANEYEKINKKKFSTEVIYAKLVEAMDKETLKNKMEKLEREAKEKQRLRDEEIRKEEQKQRELEALDDRRLASLESLYTDVKGKEKELAKVKDDIRKDEAEEIADLTKGMGKAAVSYEEALKILRDKDKAIAAASKKAALGFAGLREAWGQIATGASQIERQHLRETQKSNELLKDIKENTKDISIGAGGYR